MMKSLIPVLPQKAESLNNEKSHSDRSPSSFVEGRGGASHIALTGGIGSGKSYVCRYLNRYGIEVYDCDEGAKRLMRTSTDIRAALMSLVGNGVYENQVLQKGVLARYILASDANKQAVNDIVHPAVAADYLESGLTWLESAILFESRFDTRVHFDDVVCVVAPVSLRIERIMQRDAITHAQAAQWVKRQMPQEEIINRSDYVIVNDGIRSVDAQIAHILTLIKNKKVKMETILSIAGKPGLYRLVSRGKMNLIVESLDEAHKRFLAFSTNRVISLADISMYTDKDDVPLWQVLENVGRKEQSKPCSFNYKKASPTELHDYFSEVLPEYDRERVHDGDIKKLLQWYNILVENGITDFKATLQPTEGDNVAEREG